MKLLVSFTYYIIYAFLCWGSWLGIVGAAMNRDTSFIATFGFYLFMSLLVATPVLFYLLVRANKLKWIVITGGVPLIIYGAFLGHYIATNDIYW